jgi:putative transposase
MVPSGHVEDVDIGICRPAVTSGRRFLGKRQWREVEARYFRLQRKLQSKGTKSAKRRLKALSGRRLRFRRDCDHVLSKRIVEGVPTGSIIAIEGLKGIRARIRVRDAKGRRRHHGWSYGQLGGFVRYKAEDAGAGWSRSTPASPANDAPAAGTPSALTGSRSPSFAARPVGFGSTPISMPRATSSRHTLWGRANPAPTGPSSVGLSRRGRASKPQPQPQAPAFRPESIDSIPPCAGVIRLDCLGSVEAPRQQWQRQARAAGQRPPASGRRDGGSGAAAPTGYRPARK